MRLLGTMASCIAIGPHAWLHKTTLRMHFTTIESVTGSNEQSNVGKLPHTSLCSGETHKTFPRGWPFLDPVPQAILTVDAS